MENQEEEKKEPLCHQINSNKEMNLEDDNKTQKRPRRKKNKNPPYQQNEQAPTLSKRFGNQNNMHRRIHLTQKNQVITSSMKPHLNSDQLIDQATKNQVVLQRQQGSEVDLNNVHSIIKYLSDNGDNSQEIYTLKPLAEGGEAKVWKADLKQPLEVVVKTVLPQKKGQATFETSITESHLINLLENKDHVVSIQQEIIEIDEKNKNILSYITVVEQAVHDLSNIIDIWKSYERSHENLEYFSNHKLFYFLFTACQAMQYLHDQKIYYGDMKEKNLLVFRDYSVKLGDFGSSLKLKEGAAPSDQLYEVISATLAYSTKRIQEAIQNNDDSMLSEKELIENDYHTLRSTFKNIRQQCEDYFNQQAIQVQSQTQETPFFQYQFSENSLFCQLLDDLENGESLTSLIDNYKAKVSKNDEFILEFCEQLIIDEKYSALFNILKLWRHQHIPFLVKNYFDQEERKEFTFLQVGQGQVQNKQDVIKQIHEYVQGLVSNIQKDLLPYIVILTRYKGPLLEAFYNEFYRKAFGEYFEIKIIPSQVMLLDDVNNNNGEKVNAYLESVKLSDDPYPRSINEIDQFVLDRDQTHTFSYFVLFLAFTTNSTEWFDQTVFNYLEQMEQLLTNPFLLEEQFTRAAKPNSYLLNLFKNFHQLNLFQLAHRMIASQGYRDYFRYSYNLTPFHYVFTYQAMIIQYLNKIQMENYLEAKIERYEWLRKQVQLDSQKNCFHKAFYFSSTQHILTQIQKDFKLEPKFLIQNIKDSRVIMKRTFGEIGNQMSLNGYELFKLTQLLREQDESTSDLDQEAFFYLVKACSYSNKDQRFHFILDLIMEYDKHEGKEKRDETIEQTQHLSKLFYLLIKVYYKKEKREICQQEGFWTEFTKSQKVKDDFEILANQNQTFFEMLLFALDLKGDYANFHYLTREIYFKSFIPQVLKDPQIQIQNEVDLQIEGNRVQLKHGDQKQQLIITLQDEGQLTMDLVNKNPNGLLKYKAGDSISFEDTITAGSFDGKFAYQINGLSIEGERRSDHIEIYTIKSNRYVQYYGPLVNFYQIGLGMEVQSVQRQCGYFTQQLQDDRRKHTRFISPQNWNNHRRQYYGFYGDIARIVDLKDNKSLQGLEICVERGQIQFNDYLTGDTTSYKYTYDHQTKVLRERILLEGGKIVERYPTTIKGENLQMGHLIQSEFSQPFQKVDSKEVTTLYDRFVWGLAHQGNQLKVLHYPNGNKREFETLSFKMQFFEDGNVSWMKNKKSGTETWYSKDYKFSAIKIYPDEDYINYLVTFYKHDKQVGKQSSTKLGTGKVFEFYKDQENQNSGQLMYIETIENDQLLRSKFYYIDGEKLRDCRYWNWAPQGQEECFYPNGQQRKISYFEKGEYHGKTEFFSIQGESRAVLDYHYGQLISKLVRDPEFRLLRKGERGNVSLEDLHFSD